MSTKLATMPEEKKSRNPLKKLLRTHSQSHEHSPMNGTAVDEAAVNHGRSRASTMSKSDATANHTPSQRIASAGIKRANTVVGHNTNPFMSQKPGTSHESAFDILGTGQSISGPRQNSHHSQRQSSNPNNSLSSPQYSTSPFTPGNNSRTPSQMTAHGGTPALAASFEDEKKNILPLPILEPNDFLPLELKQSEKSAFTDYFVIPDAQSGKDRKLGDGASANVRVAQHKTSHKLYALKKFMMLEKETPAHFYERASKEFVIAKRLSGTIHMVDTYALLKVQTMNNMNRGWGFILEYCKGGDLFSLISRTGWKSSPLNEKLCLFKQITNGVRFMHENGIVHRDLKPENVLLTEQGVCKLTDFGVAEYCREDPLDPSSNLKLGTSFVGSPPYVPPEVVAVKEGTRKTYDPFAPDMWALGMILFCLVYQGTPFQKAQSSDAAYREFNQTYKRFVSEHPSFKGKDLNVGPGSEFKYAKDFQSPHTARLAWKLCDFNPESRYTMEDLLSDTAFINLECCVDEASDHHVVYWDRCKAVFEEPSSPKSEDPSAKASPQVMSKSMLDFSDIPNDPLPSSNNCACHSSPKNGTAPPQSNSSPTSLEPPQAVSLPTLAEVCESVSTSPTTDMMNNLTIDTHSEDHFYETDSAMVTPSTDSLLTFSPRSTFNPSPPARSMIDDLATGVVAPPPSNTASLQMNRASSFSSVTSRTSGRSSGSLNSTKKTKHHHLDVTNIQHRSSFIMKKK